MVPIISKILDKIKRMQGTVLYDNSNGSNGTITLSDSAENYDYLEIFFADMIYNHNYYSAKIANPNGKQTELGYSEIGDAIESSYFFRRQIQINDKTISTIDDKYGFINVTGSLIDKQNRIYIYKVVGYKD